MPQAKHGYPVLHPCSSHPKAWVKPGWRLGGGSGSDCRAILTNRLCFFPLWLDSYM